MRKVSRQQLSPMAAQWLINHLQPDIREAMNLGQVVRELQAIAAPRPARAKPAASPTGAPPPPAPPAQEQEQA